MKFCRIRAKVIGCADSLAFWSAPLRRRFRFSRESQQVLRAACELHVVRTTCGANAPNAKTSRQLKGIRNPSSKTLRCAFTLIELLVVVAIIAILASLLLPVLSRGKDAGRSTECRGNLRDIGLATRLYLDEFDVYPATWGNGLLGYNDVYGVLMMSDWKETLLPYIGLQGGHGESISKLFNMRKLRCPQMIRKQDGALGNGQYALNASGTAQFQSIENLGLGGCLDGDFKSTMESRVRAPADMIAVGDVAPGTSSELPPGFPIRKTFGSSSAFDVCSTNSSLWPGTSHSGQANVLFCDGHVESARQTNWVSDSVRFRWNSDHEPHPETWARP